MGLLLACASPARAGSPAVDPAADPGPAPAVDGDDAGNDGDDGDGDGGDRGDLESSDDVSAEAVELAAPATPGDRPTFDMRSAEDAWPVLMPALAAAKRGHHDAAIQAARPLLDEADLELRAAAGWIVIRAAERAGRRADVLATWQRLAVGGPLQDRARLELAADAEKRGDLDRALALWAQVSPVHAEADLARLRRATMLLDRGELAGAASALTGLRMVRLPRDRRPELSLLRGDLLRRQGQRDRAVHQYVVAWRSGHGSTQDAALERLAALGAAPGPMARVDLALTHPALGDGRRLRGEAAKRQHAAIAAMDRLAAGVPGLADYAHGVLASNARQRREEALELLGRAADAATEPGLAAAARYRRGDLLGRMNRDTEAAAELEAALLLGGEPALQRKLRYRLARLLLHIGRGVDAEHLLQELATMSGGTEHELLSLWALGWRRWQLGDLAETERYFAQLHLRAESAQTGGKQPWRAKAGYWLARVAATRGDEAAASERFAQVARRWPHSYYGVLALDRLHEIDAAKAGALLGAPSPTGDEPPTSIADIRIPRDPQIAEAVLLARLGERERARKLLRGRLSAGLPAGAVQLLAALYEVDGQHRGALAVLARYVRSAGPPEATTLALWRGAFPTPWREHFETAAQETGLPRALLYAIARTESSFEPRAQSGAGAIGLMQLLPSAASRVAGLWKLPKPSAAGLRKPGVNVAVGSRYLLELSRLFRDNHALVAVGYNAGPYAMKRWLEQHSGVPTDVLVETLPSGGARAYAMSIVSTAASYAWLYPQWQEQQAVRLGRPAMAPQSLGPFLTGPAAALSAAPPLAPADIALTLR